VAAIAEEVEDRLDKELGVTPGHVEGKRAGDWVLLDYIDFVVHVFLQDKRSFYGLDRLWGDAPSLELPPPTDGPDPGATHPPAAP
jgi:ribosome-associated protein